MVSLAFISAAFLLSIFVVPWWGVMFLGVLVLGFWRAYPVAILGGVLMDLLYGHAGVAFGFPYLYTAVFVFLSVLVWHLERTMLE